MQESSFKRRAGAVVPNHKLGRWLISTFAAAIARRPEAKPCQCRVGSASFARQVLARLVAELTGNYSPSLEGKYSEHGSPARRGAPSFRGTSLFVGGDTREGLVKINVARRAELSR